MNERREEGRKEGRKERRATAKSPRQISDRRVGTSSYTHVDSKTMASHRPACSPGPTGGGGGPLGWGRLRRARKQTPDAAMDVRKPKLNTPTSSSDTTCLNAGPAGRWGECIRIAREEGW